MQNTFTYMKGIHMKVLCLQRCQCCSPRYQLRLQCHQWGYLPKSPKLSPEAASAQQGVSSLLQSKQIPSGFDLSSFPCHLCMMNSISLFLRQLWCDNLRCMRLFFTNYIPKTFFASFGYQVGQFQTKKNTDFFFSTSSRITPAIQSRKSLGFINDSCLTRVKLSKRMNFALSCTTVGYMVSFNNRDKKPVQHNIDISE